MQSAEIKNNLAKIIALRIVDDREMVIDFLHSRTDYEIPEECSNEYLASVLTDMTFDEKKQEKLAKLIVKDVEYVKGQEFQQQFVTHKKPVRVRLAG